MKMKACIARYRRAALVKFLAKQSKSFIKRFENLNYDLDSNGEKRVLMQLSRFPFANIFDVGANEGDWALMVSELFPAATIHAFEIAPPTYQTLCTRTKDHGNIVVNNVGLSNEEKVVEVNYFPENSTVTSVYDVHYPGEKLKMKANVVTGDAYCGGGGDSLY